MVSSGDADIMLRIIERDFRVKQLANTAGQTLLGAWRKDHLHFVINAGDAGGGSFHMPSIRQFHIPHFVVAEALTADAQDAVVTMRVVPCRIGIDHSLIVDGGQIRGIILNGMNFLLVEDVARRLTARMKRTVSLLRKADKAVVEDDGHFFLPSITTVDGHPVESDYRPIIKAIAFERELFGTLDAFEQFGIYSAFCSMADFPSPLPQERTQRQLIEAHFGFHRQDYSDEAFVSASLKVQDLIFPRRIWGPGISTTLEEGVAALGEAVTKLNLWQCAQFALMNGMHAGSLFPALAALTGCITFDQYMDFATAHCPPDSIENQMIRSSSGYIELLGRLAQDQAP